jgi:alkanesulfonate monooxygenase SsuD/methylene tetrahydromethanopterin reductase-like flavin-dependent oxidoreductase (luciferase family)
MVWYTRRGGEMIAEVADYARQFREDLGTYHYVGEMKQTIASGALSQLGFDYLRDAAAAMVGDPDRCIEIARRYEAAAAICCSACSIPKIPHEAVMRSIELLGKHVIPELDRD